MDAPAELLDEKLSPKERDQLAASFIRARAQAVAAGIDERDLMAVVENGDIVVRARG